ncbi:MAG: YdiU family protein [Pseudomonadota bacterium]
MKDCGFRFDNSYLSLPDRFYTQLDPLPVTKPEMMILNNDLATSMGLNFSKLNLKDQAALFAGNSLPEGSQPFAQAYAGHQFGHFTILGDGRAHIWGEHMTPDERRLDIQFKGSGRTPYSRRGDGRAALGPMLREYIISEAMHALGIPTTRSLAVVTTGEDVMRETPLPGAILTRVASSHIRVGTFEFAAAQGDKNLVEALLDYTIDRHDPDIKDSENKALDFLHHVMDRQADLITHWMRVGFIHGVMNTDNMTISGETIDYGPCAFMDAYDPNTVFSSIDQMGRYAFDNQPVIAQWNVARLAEALLPLIDENIDKAVQIAEKIVNDFPALYKIKWLLIMRSKLGLFGEQTEDEQLISDLLDWMKKNHADYTNTFLDLSQEDKPSGTLFESKEFSEWYERWQARLQQNTKPLKSSLCLMKNNNPSVIPRNHKVEEALAAGNEGDLKPFHDLLSALKEPYKDREELKPFQLPPEPSERIYQTFCGT